MENINVKEGVDILKKLSLENQREFMTWVRVAKVAEDAVRDEMTDENTLTN